MKSTTIRYLILLSVLIIPSFWVMLRPGIFSMQDYHTFRLYEFNKCVADFQIPCRWTPDATFEYGQPTFNFYGQTSYAFGQLFRLFGFGVIDTIKALFIASLVLSAWSMFWLARSFWSNNLSALMAALVYTYAPYRAVDVYVRGALPEALGFVLIPLIVYFFNQYLKSRRVWQLCLFGLSMAILITTHNLSALMLAFWLGIWGLYKLVQVKTRRIWIGLILSSLMVFGLVAFYLLPVVFESQFVKIDQTVTGFYNFNNHFATLGQLLLSRFWGYGASVWENNDGLSLSVGQVQWIMPVILLGILLWKRKIDKFRDWLVLFLLGWLMLFLTHNKSTAIWNLIKPMEYIQFPWRFLGLAVFSFSLSLGAINLIITRRMLKLSLIGVVLVLVFVLNINYFKEDLWISKTDQQLFNDLSYEDQISSSYNDYYPVFAKITPTRRGAVEPILLEGSGSGRLVIKSSNQAIYHLKIDSSKALVSVAIAYFPGWVGHLDSNLAGIAPNGDYGLISLNVPRGEHQLELKFKNTLARDLGNLVSLVSVMVLILAVVIWGRHRL